MRMFSHEIVHEQSQCNNMIFQNSKLKRKCIYVYSTETFQSYKVSYNEA